VYGISSNKKIDVVTNTDKIEQLSKVSPYAGCAKNASIVIVPVYRKNGLRFPVYAQIDLSIACKNMWLMADTLGLGGVWLGIALLKERIKNVRKVLDLPEDVEAFSLFPIGYPAEAHPQQDRFDPSRIHLID
jgi:nitroreductase